MAEQRKKTESIAQIRTTKSGDRLYIRVMKDVSLKAGDMLGVNDPRDRLTSEQVSELESTGELRITTASGKSFTIYNSTFRDIVRNQE